MKQEPKQREQTAGPREERENWEEYKLATVSWYDIPGMERWLEEQANQGRFPVRLGRVLCTFDQTGVPGSRFRLEPFGAERKPSQEQLELHEQAGWTYVMTVARAYFLFYTTDPEAPELYIDWASQGLSLDRMARRMRRQRIDWLLLPLLLLLMVIYTETRDPARALYVQPSSLQNRLVQGLLTYTSFHHFPFYALVIAEAVRFWFESRIFTKTYQNLKHGLPPPPTPGNKKRVWLINATLFPFLLAIVSIWVLTSRMGPAYEPPYIPLAQLEQVLAAGDREGSGAEHDAGRQDYRSVDERFSALAPVWYTVRETVHAEVFDGSSQVREYSPHMEMVRLRVLLPAMSRAAAEAELDRMRPFDRYCVYEELEVPGLDFVILGGAPQWDGQMAALGHGSWAAVFCYQGEEDLREHIALLSSMVT